MQAGPEPAAAEAAPAKEPQTKAELYKELKSNHKNTLHLVAALLHDRDLRTALRQIEFGCQHIHAEYNAFLANQKDGEDSRALDPKKTIVSHVTVSPQACCYIAVCARICVCVCLSVCVYVWGGVRLFSHVAFTCNSDQAASLQWAADRATGHGWFNRVLQTLASIHDPEMLELCGVTAVADVLPGAELAGQEWFQQEVQNLMDLWAYLLALASTRTWSEIQHAVLCPQMIACASHTNRQAARAGMDRQRRIWEAVLRAEDVTLNGAGDVGGADRKALGAMLNDAAFNRLHFARECAVHCKQAGWDPDYEDIKQLNRAMYSKPLNSKFDLEDTFAHLAAVHKLSTKATQFNKNLGLQSVRFFLGRRREIDVRVCVCATNISPFSYIVPGGPGTFMRRRCTAPPTTTTSTSGHS